MNKTKIAITIDHESVKQLDQLIKKHIYLNRSQAIQEAVKEKLKRIEAGGIEKQSGTIVCQEWSTIIEGSGERCQFG